MGVVDQLAARAGPGAGPRVHWRRWEGKGRGRGFRGSGSPVLTSAPLFPPICGNRQMMGFQDWVKHAARSHVTPTPSHAAPPPAPPLRRLHPTGASFPLSISHVHPHPACFLRNPYCHLPLCLCVCVFLPSPPAGKEPHKAPARTQQPRRR